MFGLVCTTWAENLETGGKTQERDWERQLARLASQVCGTACWVYPAGGQAKPLGQLRAEVGPRGPGQVGCPLRREAESSERPEKPEGPHHRGALSMAWIGAVACCRLGLMCSPRAGSATPFH